MGGKGGAGKGSPEEPTTAAGEQVSGDGKWHWEQKGEELQPRIPREAAITKKDVAVSIKRFSLQVTVRGDTVIDGKLSGAVEVDECTWCIAPGGMELQVMLTKQKAEDWPSLLAGP